MRNNYDIIVIGGGISGLLMASELSKYHSLLLIDRESQIPSNKYWLTDQDSYLLNPDLHHNVDSKYKHMDFIAFNDYKLRVKGEYILWDTEKIIAHLKTIIIENGGEIKLSQRFYSYSYQKNNIIIKANDQQYKGKLLLDCMGYTSPIISLNNLVNISGYYILHGETLKLKKDIEPICLANVIVSSNPVYLEVFPTQNNYAYTIILYPQKHITINTNTYKDYKFIISESEYSEYFDLSFKPKNKLSGIVPVGRLKSTAEDRIFFYGEAAQMNPAATGTCLTKMLSNYKSIATFISNQVKTNKLMKKDLLLPKVSMKELFNNKFQLNLFNEVLNYDSNSFHKILVTMNEFPDNILNDILFSKIELANYIKYLKPKAQYFLLYQLLLKSILFK